jgi:hypothetical protein
MKLKDDSCRVSEASEVGTGQQATQLLGVEGDDGDEELKIDNRFSSRNMPCKPFTFPLVINHLILNKYST